MKMSRFTDSQIMQILKLAEAGTYTVMSKPQRQSAAADGKSVNARVDKAMARRNTGHKPAADHPWRKMAVGKSAHDGQRATP